MPSIFEPAAVTPESPVVHEAWKAEPSGSTTQSRVSSFLQPQVAPDRGAGAAGARPDDHPGRQRMRLAAQLGEHRLGDVVVAAPVGGPLGVGELVEEVAAAALGQLLGDGVDLARVVDEVAAAAVELDQRALLLHRRGGHDGDEVQPEQPGEVGLADRRRARRRLDQRGPLGDPAVAQPVEHQRAGQPVLEAAGGVHRLVLEVEVDAPRRGQREDVQVGVGAAVRVRLDLVDGPGGPGPVPARGCWRAHGSTLPSRPCQAGVVEFAFEAELFLWEARTDAEVALVSVPVEASEEIRDLVGGGPPGVSAPSASRCRWGSAAGGRRSSPTPVAGPTCCR